MRVLCASGIAALLLATTFGTTSASEQRATLDVKMPAAVASTFAKLFPKGQIIELEAEQENGVTVYDIEFLDGEVEKEAEIAADGTMLEFTIVIAEKAVPRAAMDALRLAAGGAAIRRIERIELSYEIKDGKLLELPKQITNYEALLSSGEEYAEVVVSSAGEIVEAPRWGGDDEAQEEDEGELEEKE